MIDLRKVIHLCVVSIFALAGADNVRHGVGYIRRPWTIPVRYHSGEVAVLEGLLFLAVAFGIFRFDSRARIVAIFIAGLFVLLGGAEMFVAPGIGPGGSLLVGLLVLVWLLFPTVRAQFVGGSGHQKTV